MTPDEVRRHFTEAGALLSGHFRLSSGLHSEAYLQCAKVLQWPDRAAALGGALASLLAPFRVSAVVAPAMGGVIIGHEAGRGLSVRAIFTERVDGVFALRRGFALDPGERVAVVEDVVTTGKSTREVLDVLRAAGVGARRVRVDRRPAVARVGRARRWTGCRIARSCALDVPAFDPAACPRCAAGDPLVAPGSRHLAAKT